jgi:hypothetical protein
MGKQVADAHDPETLGLFGKSWAHARQDRDRLIEVADGFSDSRQLDEAVMLDARPPSKD